MKSSSSSIPNPAAGRRSGLKGKLVASACVVATLWSGHALSQDAAIELETIEVEGQAAGGAIGPDDGYVATETTTGSKTDTPLSEIPQSVSVVTRKQMDDRQPAQLEDTLQYMAGVTASPWGVDDRFDECLIRGFDICTSAMYRDGLSQKLIGFSGFRMEPYGLQRVEVLKGPASVLYGENDAGGMINAITKRPTETPFYDAFGSYGSFDTVTTGFDVGGPVDEAGIWSYRLTGLYRDGSTETDDSENDRIYIAPAMTWEPDAGTSLTILANYQWDQLEPLVFLPVAGVDYPAEIGALPRSFVAGDSDFNRYDAHYGAIGYQFSHEIGERWTVRQNLRYTRQETDYRDLYYGAFDGGPGMIDDHTMARTAYTVDETAEIFAIDNQAEYDASFGPVDNKVLVGLDYTWSSADGVHRYGEAPPLDILDPDYSIPIPMPEVYQDGIESIGQVGLYAQNQARIAERLLVTFGGRQAWVDNDFEDRLSDTDTSQEDSAFTGNVGLGYLLDGRVTPYASYSESFIVNLGQTRTGDMFEPSRGEQYEVGVKYEPTFFPGYITAAVFDLRKTNVPTTDPEDPVFQVQTGEVRHRGLELEASADLALGFSMIAAYTYLDAEILEDNDGFVGYRPSLVPEHQASLWANYEFGGGAAEGLSFGAGARYIGSTFGDNANTIDVPGYTLFDAALRFERGNLQAAINVSNLFDKVYYSTCYENGGCIHGEGRNIKGMLTAKF